MGEIGDWRRKKNCASEKRLTAGNVRRRMIVER
jgi:hypothetical protein